MNLHRVLVLASSIAAAVALPWVAAAQEPLQIRTQNGISYVTGGVGSEQQDRLRELADQGYALKLVFAEQGTGAYVGDVHVIVSDRAGRVLLDTVTDGPGFYAKVPPGEYLVTAEYNGMRQARNIRAGGSTPVTFHWPKEGGSAALPADARAPHGDGAPLAPGHAGAPAGTRR